MDLVQTRKALSRRFPGADRLVTDRDGAECSTHPEVAVARALRMPEKATAVDLTCGIGGDLLPLAGRAARVIAMDLDIARLQMARVNLKEFFPKADALYLSGNAGQLPFRLPDNSFVFLDPQRRTEEEQERRRGRGGAFNPSLISTAGLLKFASNLAVKLPPDFWPKDLPDPLKFQAELEWVAVGNELKELTVYHGNWRQRSGRSVLMLPENKRLTPLRERDIPPQVKDRVGVYVQTVHPGVLHSGILPEALRKNAWPVMPSLEVWSSLEPVRSPWVKNFRLEAQRFFPLEVPRIKTFLGNRKLMRLDVINCGHRGSLDFLKFKLEMQEGVPGEPVLALMVLWLGNRERVLIASPVEAGKEK